MVGNTERKEPIDGERGIPLAVGTRPALPIAESRERELFAELPELAMRLVRIAGRGDSAKVSEGLFYARAFVQAPPTAPACASAHVSG